MEKETVWSGSNVAWAVAFAALIFFISGLLVGINGAAGVHQYHAWRTVSVSGSILVRAVQSPASVDDNVVETIIDGKLVSRSKPDNFSKIWESAK